ncbi:phage tail protein [bacterium]|nr:phage tail protein [bacterium]
MGVRRLNTANSDNNALVQSLLEEDPFVYAHLVKFEKPLKTEEGKSAQRAKDYTYITDGSHDFVFDDGSTDIQGNANGAQTYRAGKLLDISGISETIQAKVSGINIDLSAAALGTAITTRITTTSSSVTALDDLVEAGFREGDTMLLLSGSGANHTAKVRINYFSNNNLTANVDPLTKVTNDVELELSSLANESNVLYSLNFDSPEVEGVLSNRSSTTYARYINREVFIYKAHINPETGQSIGAPYLMFKGIIQGGKLTEDPGKSSKVSWKLTNHWGDFSRVQGRLTSDSHHRALDGNGLPDLTSAIKPEYTNDLGFQHSEQALNLMATYQVSETRYKEKKRGGLAGLFGGKKLSEYEVEVDRDVDLRFNLDAKYLPVVYGIAKIDSIPFFVDTINSNARDVFCAYALCEGEIGGLYDIYFDDTSGLCIDKNDSEARSVQNGNNTVDVLCYGRMDRGDTLTARTVTSGTARAYGGSLQVGADYNYYGSEGNYIDYAYAPVNTAFTFGASIQGGGITHEKGNSFTTPIDTKLIFHSGKFDQKADSLLLSNAGNFKVGTDYYTGTGAYWGSRHQVRDTAYVVAKYTISEGETSIPSLDFVVRGKGIECNNYDYAYEQHIGFAVSDASDSLFDIGEVVDIKSADAEGVLGTATIADLYDITNMDGSTSLRVRFTDLPPFGTHKSFFMQKQGSTEVIHLTTFDYADISGTVPTTLEATISAAVASSNSTSATLTLSTPSASMQKALEEGDSLLLDNANTDPASRLASYSYAYSGSGNTVTNVGNTGAKASSLVGKKVTVKNAIQLAADTTSQSAAFLNMQLILTTVNNDNTVVKQQRRITSYDGTTKVATVDQPFNSLQLPKATDTYEIRVGGSNDQRVSTNPAMQVLDYLTSARYGANLNIQKDIDTESFYETARLCDTRSDVTMLVGANLVVGDVYKFVGAGKTKWQGTVLSSTSVVTLSGTAYYNVVFGDVLGKIANKWIDYRTYENGDLVYHSGGVHAMTSAGSISQPSTSSSVSVSLTKVSGSGPSTAAVDLTLSTFDGNPVVKKYVSDVSVTSGYSLYDSDDVKYWRMLGWESSNQRHVTRHQTNAVINTAKSVFSNINGFLGHFNGMIRDSNGKYALAIKTAYSGVTTFTTSGGDQYIVEDIGEDDIIGSINVEDAGAKGTFNQVSVTINDPQNRFEGRQISMFDSTYLKEDRMVHKKGDIKTPYVNNYFNARINARQYLDQSRAGLKVNFTMGPKGILLRAGDIIRVSYARFGWVNKYYRITNLTFEKNCLTKVTAEEHNDEAYLIRPDFPEEIVPGDLTIANVKAPEPPNVIPSLTGTLNARGGVELAWTNTTDFNPATYSVEIWRADTPDGLATNHSSLKKVGFSKSDNYVDQITNEGATVKYYWIRYAVVVSQKQIGGLAPRELFSTFFPTGNGVQGKSDGARDAPTISFTNLNVTILADANGNPSGFSNTGFAVDVNIGTTRLPHDNSSSPASPSFRVTNQSVSTGITLGNASTSSDTFTRTRANITAMSNVEVGLATFVVTVRDTLGAERAYTYTQSFVKSRRGVDGTIGVDGDQGARTAAAVLYYQTPSATAPAAPTASNYNFTTGLFGTNTSGWDENAPTFAAGNTNKYWYARVNVAEASVGGSQTITVGTVLQGIGFSGLVTFTGSQSVTDGTNGMSFGAQGTTTIDGANITTGIIQAARLDVGQINVTQTLNYQANPTNLNQLQNGPGYQTQAFTQPSQVNIAQTTNYVAPPTQVSQLQNDQGFQSGITQLSQLQNNEGFQSGLGNLSQFANDQNFQNNLSNLSQFTNDAGFQTQAFTQPGQLNVTQLTAYVAPPTNTNQLTNGSGYQTQAITFSATAISGGKIGLSTSGMIIGNSGTTVSASNSIILDTTSGNNSIKIYDGSTLRVKIGKL